MPRTSSFPDMGYDPLGPVRSVRSKTSDAETKVEMASVINLLSVNHPEGCVTREDLNRAGFENPEIDRCLPDAVVLARKRLGSREVRLDQAA